MQPVSRTLPLWVWLSETMFNYMYHAQSKDVGICLNYLTVRELRCYLSQNCKCQLWLEMVYLHENSCTKNSTCALLYIQENWWVWWRLVIRSLKWLNAQMLWLSKWTLKVIWTCRQLLVSFLLLKLQSLSCCYIYSMPIAPKNGSQPSWGTFKCLSIIYYPINWYGTCILLKKHKLSLSFFLLIYLQYKYEDYFWWPCLHREGNVFCISSSGIRISMHKWGWFLNCT